MTKEPPLPAVRRPSSPLALTGSDISIDPRSHSSCGSKLLPFLAIQTVAQMSFFVIACLLTAGEGCDQTGELRVRETMSLVFCVESLWHEGESDM